MCIYRFLQLDNMAPPGPRMAELWTDASEPEMLQFHHRARAVLEGGMRGHALLLRSHGCVGTGDAIVLAFEHGHFYGLWFRV